MILKSAEKTYTAVTDENGAFSFKIVVACGAVVLIATGAVIFVILKKKSKK